MSAEGANVRREALRANFFGIKMCGIVPRPLICSGYETNENLTVTYGQTGRRTMSIDQLCRKGLEVEG